MKPPYLSNGLTYCHTGTGERVCTGSQMGRRERLPDDPAQPIKLHLRRVPFVDQCYDQGGAYWGSPANLFCAWGESVACYVRAGSRTEARELVLSGIPGARFYN